MSAARRPASGSHRPPSGTGAPSTPGKRPSSAMAAAATALDKQAAAPSLGPSIRVHKGPVEDLGGPLLLSSKAVPLKPRPRDLSASGTFSFSAAAAPEKEQAATGASALGSSLRASSAHGTRDAQPSMAPEGLSLVGSAAPVASASQRPSSAARQRVAPSPSRPSTGSARAPVPEPEQPPSPSVRRSVTFAEGIAGPAEGGTNGVDVDFPDDMSVSDVAPEEEVAASATGPLAGELDPRALRGPAAASMQTTLKRYLNAKKAREESEENVQRVQAMLRDKRREMDALRSGEDERRLAAERERAEEEKARERRKEDKAREKRLDAIRQLREHREAKRAAEAEAAAASASSAAQGPAHVAGRAEGRGDGASDSGSSNVIDRRARGERYARAAEERMGTSDSPAPKRKKAADPRQSAWKELSREFESSREGAMSPTRVQLRAALAGTDEARDEPPRQEPEPRPSSRNGFFDGGRAMASSIAAMAEERRSLERPSIDRSFSISPPPADDVAVSPVASVKPVISGAATATVTKRGKGKPENETAAPAAKKAKTHVTATATAEDTLRHAEGASEGERDEGQAHLPSGISSMAEDASTRAFLSATKLQSVMAYLDEVERAADDDALSVLSSQPRSMAGLSAGGLSAGSLRSHARPSDAFDAIDEMDMLETASHAAASAYQGSDVQSTIVSQKLEIDDKRKTIEMLRGALQAHRERSRAEQAEREKEERARLTAQKAEYEGVMKRHLAFIDQLLNDKKTLSERCAQLVEEMQASEKKFGARITALEESHARELKKTKEAIMAAEKVKREEWVSDRTKQIKEITIKGLEPEIQRMIAKHKAEVKALNAAHQNELARQKEELQRAHERAVEELRLRAESEREEALVKERESQRARAQKSMEDAENDWQLQRRRLISERDAERSESERKWREEREKLDQMIASLKEAVENAEETVRRRFALEMRDARAAMEIEKGQWQDQVMHKNEQIIRQREQEMRERLKKERDQEIEAVIARLEEETSGSATELQKRHQAELKAVREKLEAELARAEKSERAISDKYVDARDKLAATEREALAVRQQLEQFRLEHTESARLLNKLQSERDRMAEKIREEFADRLSSYQEDVRRTRNEMEELRKAHAKELQEMQRSKESELDALHGRVRAAMQKRDDAARALREQLQESELKVAHLEKMLEKQRRELLQ